MELAGADVIRLDRAPRRRPRPKRPERVPRGPVRRVRSPQPPRAVEHFLVAAIVRAMRHVTKAMARALDGKLEAIAKPDADEEREDAARLDAPPPPPADGDVDAAIREVTRAAYKAIEESGPQLKEAATTAAKRTAKHSEREFGRLKITLKREPEIDKLITASTKDVVSRFKGTVESQLEKLEALLDDGYGMRHETLAKEIARQLEDVSESRAEFLARDAVLSINSKITTARMKAAGVDRFTWTTSGDERVRDSHAELDGQTFSYADPPIVDGVPALPGEPPLCRCTAFPELPELDDEDEAA